MYYQPKTILFHNGNFVKASEAQTNLFSQSLHYGIGVIDGLRAYQTTEGPQIFKASQHYERFLASAEKMNIRVDYEVEELIHLSYRLLEENNLASAYIRPLVYLGANMDMETSDEVNILLTAWKWENYRGSDPLDIMISSYQRLNPKSSFLDAKITGHYVNSVMAINEAKHHGYDAALLLDENGFVAEGAGSNFFYEKDGMLYTPPAGHILPGITRGTVFELAKELGVKVIEKLFTPREMENADVAFFTGTASEIAPIKSVNGHKFQRDWEDTIGREIQVKYHQRVILKDYDSYSII